MSYELREDEAVQMYCCMLIRSKHDSHGHGPEHVDKVLRYKKYGHTPESLRAAVDGYIDSGCGISG